MEKELPNSRLPPIDNRSFRPRSPEPVVASSHSQIIACNTYQNY